MNLKRLTRAVEYFFSYIFIELPKGIDFSLRMKSNKSFFAGNHGYALTSKKALQNILIGIPLEGKSFLDIGSGKGGCIYYAYQLGCVRSEGVECEKVLHDIAQKNIKQLKISSFVISNHVDALLFKRYSQFDIYFIFNPFDYEIYEKVVDAIVAQNVQSLNNRVKYLICYGDGSVEYIKSKACFKFIKEGVCPYRGNLFNVFQLKTSIDV